MAYFERYIVKKTKKLGKPVDRLRLSKLDAVPPAFTPVRSILLVKGADSEQNRKGQEEGDGSATIYLEDADFDLALSHIDKNDVVNYLSDPIVGTDKATITNFNFPAAEG
jgi:hypothetical protein